MISQQSLWCSVWQIGHSTTPRGSLRLTGWKQYGHLCSSCTARWTATRVRREALCLVLDRTGWIAEAGRAITARSVFLRRILALELELLALDELDFDAGRLRAGAGATTGTATGVTMTGSTGSSRTSRG